MSSHSQRSRNTSRTRQILSEALTVFLLLICASNSSVAAPGLPRRQQASASTSADAVRKFTEHNNRGTQLLRAGRFEEAIQEMQTAHAIHPDQNLLLNIGQAHRQLGHAREALDFYSRYLQSGARPDERIKREIDIYIEQSRALIKAAEKLKAPPPKPGLPAGVHRMALSTTAQAVVVQGRLAAAQNQAHERALQRSVEQVAVWLDAPPLDKDPYVDQHVYKNPTAFVIASWPQSVHTEDNILSLELGVDINVDALREALKGHVRDWLPKADLGRRILILATETLGRDQIFGWPTVIWGQGYFAPGPVTALHRLTGIGGMETAITEEFTKAGFSIIDVNVLRGRLAPRPIFEVLNLSASAARSIAKKTDADLVVIVQGKAQLAPAAQLAGMHSGQANISARLVSVQDGRVIAATNQHSAQIHLDADTARMNALNEAGGLAAIELLRRLQED